MSCFFFCCDSLGKWQSVRGYFNFFIFFVDNMEKECYVMDRKDVSTRKG